MAKAGRCGGGTLLAPNGCGYDEALVRAASRQVARLPPGGLIRSMGSAEEDGADERPLDCRVHGPLVRVVAGPGEENRKPGLTPTLALLLRRSRLSSAFPGRAWERGERRKTENRV